MKIGQLLKKMRIERGLSQNKLSEGICDRHTLASYENQTTDIPTKTLIRFLFRMNIPIDEFFLLLRNQKSSESKEEINSLYKEYIKYGEVREEKLIKIKVTYKETGDMLYLATYLQLYGAKFKKKDRLSEFREKEYKNILKLKKYLDSVETWGFFEISVFMNCLYLFDNMFIITNFKNVLSKAEFYSKNRGFDKTILVLCINSAIYFFENKEYELVLFFIDKAKLSNNYNIYLRERIILKYIELVVSFKIGKIGRNSMESFIQGLKLIGEDELIEELKKIYQL